LTELHPEAGGDPHSVTKCHVIGLNLSRAEGLAALAAHPLSTRKRELLARSKAHLDKGGEQVGTGGWMADHWVGTFAVTALEEFQHAACTIGVPVPARLRGQVDADLEDFLESVRSGTTKHVKKATKASLPPWSGCPSSQPKCLPLQF